MLDTQYRMNPQISSFPRRIFYDGSLLDGSNVIKSDYGGKYLFLYACELKMRYLILFFIAIRQQSVIESPFLTGSVITNPRSLAPTSTP